MSTKLTADLNAVQNAPIELEYLNGDLNIIQKLDDEPNDVGGLTSAQLKAKFDEAGNAIKDYINNDLIPAILAADATEAERTAAEASRVYAESLRVAAETAREQAEAERAKNEAARESSETARGNAESARATAEQNRATAENTRANAEMQRVQTEADRKTAETARAEAESKRASAENSRASNENQRGTNESARQTAEQARETAEQQRQTNEQARQAAENARNSWGEYSAVTEYDAGNKVSSGGSSYVCIKPCKGVAPPDVTYWQLIAQRGNDGKGAPTDELPQAPGVASAGSAETYSRGDHRHPKELPDGGSVDQVLTKTANGSKWADAKKTSYYKTFTAAQWTQTDAEATLSIAKSEHGLSGSDVFAQVSILVNGSYRKGTWASIETYAIVESNGNITLHTPEAFAGAVLLIG